MKHLLISLSLLYIGIGRINGHSLPKVELKQPSNLIYKVTEEDNGRTLVISNPHPEKPTLREIIYYHILEKPYYQEDESEKDTSAVSLDFDDTARPFTNGQGYQFLNQPESNEALASRRRKRDIKPKWTHRNKRRTRKLLPKAPYLSKLDLSRLPQIVKQLLTNAKLDKEDGSSEYLNNYPKTQEPGGGASQDDKSYGMDLIGDSGIVWNKLQNPKYAYLVGSIISQMADKIQNNDTPNSESESNESNSSGISSLEISGSNESEESPEIYASGSEEDTSSNESPENSASTSLENFHESLENSNSDSVESGSGSIESGSDSDESDSDSTSDSKEDSASDEYNEGSDSSEIDSLENNKDGNNNELQANEDFSSKLNDLLNKLHNIFVKNNSSIVVKPNGPDKPVDFELLDLIHDLFNSTKIENNFGDIDKKNPKEHSILTILEGFFTNIIKNDIIINNNVPDKSSNVLPQKDKSDDLSTTEIPHKGTSDRTEKPNTNKEITTISSSTIEDQNIENGFTTTERIDVHTSKPSKEDEYKNESYPSSEEESDDVGSGDELPDDKNSVEDEVTTKSSIPDEPIDKENAHSNVTPDDNDGKDYEYTTEPSISDEHVDKDNSHTNVIPDNNDGKDDEYKTEPSIPDEHVDKDETHSNVIPDDNDGKDDEIPDIDNTEEPPKESKPTHEEERPSEKNELQNHVDPEKDKDPNNKLPEVEQKIDYMLDLMNNEKFWNFMGDLAGKYLESLMTRTNVLIKEEIKYQMRAYLDAVNELEAKIEETAKIEAEKLRRHKENNRKEKEIENTTKIPEKANDKEQLNIKANHLYGNTVGNNQVTNVYIFYPNNNINEIIKQIKQIANKNNSTNIFTFGPHNHKHPHINLNKDKDTAKPGGNHHNNVEPTDSPFTISTSAADVNEISTELTVDFNTEATDADVTEPTFTEATVTIETDSTAEVTSEADVNDVTPEITTEGTIDEIGTESSTLAVTGEDNIEAFNEGADASITTENTEGIITDSTTLEIATEASIDETTDATDSTSNDVTEQFGTESTIGDVFSPSDGLDLTPGGDKVIETTTADATDKIVLTDATTTEETSTVASIADDVITEPTTVIDESITESTIDEDSTKTTESSTVYVTTESSSSAVTEETTATAISDITDGTTITGNLTDEVTTEKINLDITSEVTTDVNTESTTNPFEVTTTVNEDLTSEPTTLEVDDISSATDTTAPNIIEDVLSTETTTDVVKETSTLSQDLTDNTEPTSEGTSNNDQEDNTGAVHIEPNEDENSSHGEVTIEKDASRESSKESSVHIEPNVSSVDNDSGHIGEVTIGKGSSEEKSNEDEARIKPAPTNSSEVDKDVENSEEKVELSAEKSENEENSSVEKNNSEKKETSSVK